MNINSKTVTENDLSIYPAAGSASDTTKRERVPPHTGSPSIGPPHVEPTHTDPPHIERSFKIPSYVGFVAPGVDRIVRMIRRARCIPGKEQDVSGALMEALANAVIHGNRQRPEKMVHIRVRYEPHKCLSIAVRDEGAGFDPTAVPDPTCPDNLACDHGRGILMMRAFMDEVHFEKNGTECHLTKKCDNPVTATIKDYASRAADFLHSHVHHHHRS